MLSYVMLVLIAVLVTVYESLNKSTVAELTAALSLRGALICGSYFFHEYSKWEVVLVIFLISSPKVVAHIISDLGEVLRAWSQKELSNNLNHSNNHLKPDSNRNSGKPPNDASIHKQTNRIDEPISGGRS